MPKKTNPKKTNITIPGFQFASIHCGIKDDPKKLDLSLIYSEEADTLCDGVYTLNKVFAAPVAVCREVSKRGRAQLVVINSGIANACTGAKGLHAARATQAQAGKLFGLKPTKIFISSTGKIGDQLPLAKLLRGLKQAKSQLSAKNFAKACVGIMTTDQYPKYSWVRGRIAGKPYTIAVLAKGAGMLCPNMATMLAYMVTDLKMSRPVMKKFFREAVDQTLNRVTVDGDTSTNDTVLILANGRAGNKIFSADSPAGQQVARQMKSLLEDMAKKIALDGEGATKCCTVHVEGAKNQADAKKIAYAIGNSPLVKTALFGCDPNWGRIVAAVGYSGANIIQEEISVSLGKIKMVKHGQGTGFNAKSAVAMMKQNKHLEMFVGCGNGPGKFHIYMSDLTYDYIHLNAEYHT